MEIAQQIATPTVAATWGWWRWHFRSVTNSIMKKKSQTQSIINNSEHQIWFIFCQSHWIHNTPSSPPPPPKKIQMHKIVIALISRDWCLIHRMKKSTYKQSFLRFRKFMKNKLCLISSSVWFLFIAYAHLEIPMPKLSNSYSIMAYIRMDWFANGLYCRSLNCPSKHIIFFKKVMNQEIIWKFVFGNSTFYYIQKILH